MNVILDAFHQVYPGIIIEHDPTSAPDYNEALETQLQFGTAPDLFYLRSFSISRHLFENGYIDALDDLYGLKENFTPEMLSAWSTKDGRVYGVPFIATAHGVYYNQDIFASLGLEVPRTWEELLRSAKRIQDAGYIPFANTTGDPWTAAELLFMNLAPNYVGGREGRMAYLNGQRCFNDAHIVATFQALADIAPYLPPVHAQLSYEDSRQLFLQGKAAMFFGGSWDIAYFERAQPGFQWSVFAPPPPAGQPGYMTFHLDAGIGLNAASRHKEEARIFLQWLTTTNAGTLLGNQLPGFFPMHKDAITLQNPHAAAFLTLAQTLPTDVRFTWEDLMDGTPSGYALVRDASVAVLRGGMTPQEAADILQKGLETWFLPAQTCPP